MQVEAMRYALNKINRNKSEILYGLKLGYYIHDTCSNTNTIRQMFMNMMFITRNIGIVGPPMSTEAVFVAALAGILDIPVISPSASSSIIDNRVKYYNIFRAIPSDAVQVAAILSLLRKFNWTYVSAVCSDGYNGKESLDLFASLAATVDICIARRTILTVTPTDKDYADAVKDLKSDPKADVVVLFTNSRHTKKLLSAVGTERQFTWISGTGWSTEMTVARNASSVINGSIVLQYAEKEDAGFIEYFLNLKLHKNSYTWFKEFWSETFRCNGGLRNDPRPKCTGNESLVESGLSYDFKLAKRIIYSVETFSCVLRYILAQWCPTKDLRCLKSVGSGLLLLRLKVIKLLKQQKSVCEGLSDSRKFNEFGYLSENLRILRFNGSGYEEIGLWKYNHSSGSMNLIMYLSNLTAYRNWAIPVSVCSLPCELGEVKIDDETSPKCCFTCKLCAENNIVVNNTCRQCPKYTVTSRDYLECNELPRVYISLGSTISWPTIAGSAVGFCLNTVFLWLFIKYRTSRIVKATSRELSFIIFLSLYACFASPFVFLVTPSKIICGLQRLAVGMCLTGCYTPLMLKTNRIYRIFKASEIMRHKPPFVSPKSQILICLSLLGMQLLLGVMWLVGDSPDVAKLIINNKSQVAVLCKYDSTFIIFLNLIPCFILMAISTVYAFRTRKFPANFNEAHSTSITMGISCLLWGIFIPLTMLLKVTNNNVFLLTYVIANFTVIIGLVTLIGLFGPTLKKLVYFKEENATQERFRTFQMPASSNELTITTGATKSTNEGDKTIRQRPATKDVGTNTSEDAMPTVLNNEGASTDACSTPA